MYTWTLRRPLEEEEIWEMRFWEEVPGQWNIKESLNKKTIELQIVFGDKKSAEQWKAREGGSISKTPPRSDWQKPIPIPKPIKIRDQFLITQESDTKEIGKLRQQYPERSLISIPPEMAFGTGTHATTRTCLRLLYDVVKEISLSDTPKTCLDLGTGSGILAIAAQKLGVKKIVAIEHDETALEIAKINTQKNSELQKETKNAIQYKVADLIKKPSNIAPKDHWDIVLANMFSEVLIELMPHMAKALNTKKPESALICSGILREQEKDVVKSAKKNKLTLIKAVRVGKWVTLLLRK